MSDPAMTDHAELARAIERLLPITIHNTPDYAEVSFGECRAQAMTMEPDTWLALNSLPNLLAEIAALRVDLSRKHDACQIAQDQVMENGFRATQAERQRDEAVGLLRPFAEAADGLDDRTRDHDHIWEQPAAMSIDAGNLRAARTFLASMEPKT